MREIKFKALSLETSGCDKHWIYWKLGETPEYSNLDMETVCQYTGLKDKNKNEIYEGDILSHTLIDGIVRYYKVWREAGGLVINEFQNDFHKNPDNIDVWSAIADMQTKSFITGNCELIGNIYKNPELL